MRLSLFLRLVLTLAATGLLPLTISLYQLRVNKDALHEQLQSTHSLAARTAAQRVTAFLEPLRDDARMIRETAIHQGVRSQAMQEILYSLFDTRGRVVAVRIWNADGDEVARASRPDLAAELDVAYDAAAPPLGFLGGPPWRWLRIVERLSDEREQVALICDAAELESTVGAIEIDDEAELVLARLDGTVLAGPWDDLSAFPPRALALALSGKIRSGSNVYEGPESARDVAVAFAHVDDTEWVVLSSQRAEKAHLAQVRIRQSMWFAALGALVLTAALSSIAFLTVIRPLRRLVRAQQDLAGLDPGAGGSEIAQLEAAFEILEQRVRDQEELGRVSLGRYEVVEVIGEGAMGTVFKGWDPKLERELALKTIRLDSEDLKREKLVTTLLREAKTSASFSHPNIVTVFDAADQGKAAFIAMELIDGITLEEMIETEGRLDWRRAVCAGAAIARGLAAAHEHGLVHQDVKPANILLGRDDSIKVTDFGISQALSSASVSDGVICGTPGFIAPECLEGAGFSPRSDLFALGVLLYETLTGSHPFAGKTLRVTILNTLNQTPAPLEVAEPDLPHELAELVSRMIEKNPDRRPADAETVAGALEKLIHEHGLRWRFQLREPRERPASDSPRTRFYSLRSTQLLELPTKMGP